MTNRLFIILKNSGHIISFVCARQLLGSMRYWLPAYREIWAEKIEEMIHIYKETHKKAD